MLCLVDNSGLEDKREMHRQILSIWMHCMEDDGWTVDEERECGRRQTSDHVYMHTDTSMHSLFYLCSLLFFSLSSAFK